LERPLSPLFSSLLREASLLSLLFSLLYLGKALLSSLLLGRPLSSLFSSLQGEALLFFSSFGKAPLLSLRY